MATVPYMRLYVGDYLGDTMHLSTLEHGAYLLLIMHYWKTQEPIEISRIPAICGLTKKQFNGMKSELLSFFGDAELGKVRHHRVDHELLKVQQASKKAKAAGKASAAKRAANKASETPTKGQQRVNKNPTDVEIKLGDKSNLSYSYSYSSKQNPPPNPPSAEEVDLFAKDQGWDLDGFFVYYENNDWHVGKGSSREQVVDWRSLAKGWDERKRRGPVGNSVDYVVDDSDTSWADDLGRIDEGH